MKAPPFKKENNMNLQIGKEPNIPNKMHLT